MKTRYGLRALVYIAEKTENQDELVRIKDISEKEKISVQYLEQILYRLKKQGIVSGKRGPNGGYKISKPSNEIRISDIFEILESDPKIALCDKSIEKCENADCTTIYLWNKLNREIEKILENTTISELMEVHKIKKKCKEQGKV